MTTITTASTDEALRSLAERRIKTKQVFWMSVAGTTVFVGMCWMVWLFTGRHVQGLVPWPAWLTVWYFFLAFRGLHVYSTKGLPVREGALAKEMGKLGAR